MTLPEQSLRPRRGGLEHLAVPGNARTSQTGTPPDATAVVDAVPPAPQHEIPTRDTVPTQVAPIEPAAAPDQERPAGPPPLRRRPRDERGDRRSWFLVVVVAALVLLVGGLAAASFVRGGPASPSDGADDADEVGGDDGDGVAQPASGTLDDPQSLSADALPGSWSGAVPGAIVGEPVRWSDAAGVNTLVLSTGTGAPGETDAGGAAVAAGSLYVTLLLGEGDDPVVQRQMREPATPSCPDGTAFRDGSVRVSDHDGDGVGEVTAGWSVGCPDEAGVSTVKLSVLEGEDKYILRGTGSATGAPVAASAVGFTADPDESRWPQGSLDATATLFGDLFGG